VSLAPTAATVDGGVNPEHGVTTYRFEYVDEADFLSTGYQNAASVPQPEGSAGSAGEPQIVTATLTQLSPLSVYHYRLIATNAGGTTEGADETFTTPAEASAQGPAGSPFGLGSSVSLPGITYPSLSSLSPVPEVKARPGQAHVKPLTRAQRLSKALRACKKDKSKTKRSKCEKEARHKYAPVKEKKK
jgi:hypothetical protein